MKLMIILSVLCLSACAGNSPDSKVNLYGEIKSGIEYTKIQR